MRKITIILFSLLTVFLVACSAVDSSEVATSDMSIQVVSITTGNDSEVYVQARTGSNPVNFVAGDQVFLRQGSGPKVALSMTDSLEWLNNGNAFHGEFSGSQEVEIIFERSNGDVITGTKFTPFTNALDITAPNVPVTLTNNTDDTIDISWNANGNTADKVTLGANLLIDTCDPQLEELESAKALIDLFGPGDHLSTLSKDITVAEEEAFFAYDLTHVEATDSFACQAELYIERTDENFTTNNLVVAQEFKGMSSASKAINRVVRTFSWEQN